ncbi:putative RNA polymerase sigma factor [Alloactinosynnema sp. L-07]|nr:putative RNA polymerase sigma factor [Alloactinosynnema sp. L-07]
MTVSDSDLAMRFTEHRTHLLGVAYRLTSTLSDAEDAIQEAWLRLSALDDRARADIRDLRGWLTTVVGRLCLDRLRSAAVRRERYVGPWLPEPVVTPFGTPTSEDPLDAIVRDDGVRMAALVVLDKLTPEQRVAFVLHDAFGVPFTEIAATLGCSEATARQHASRGRRAAADADPPPRAALADQGAVVQALLAALSAGDLAKVVSLLHPDAVLVGDSDGKARTARNFVVGPDNIARFMLGLVKMYGLENLGKSELVLVNGDLAMAIPDIPSDGVHREVNRRVTAFALRDGQVAAIYDIVNPDKLTGYTR